MHGAAGLQYRQYRDVEALDDSKRTGGSTLPLGSGCGAVGFEGVALSDQNQPMMIEISSKRREGRHV